jgi:hypothetical protein
MAVLRAVDWRVRAPTVGDFLQLLAERERSAETLPLHLLQQLHQVNRNLQACLFTLNAPSSPHSMPNNTASAS